MGRSSHIRSLVRGSKRVPSRSVPQLPILSENLIRAQRPRHPGVGGQTWVFWQTWTFRSKELVPTERVKDGWFRVQAFRAFAFI